MNFSDKNQIPAFGGVASSSSIGEVSFKKQGLYTVHKSDKLLVFTNRNSNTEQYYKMGSKSFLWTGGYRINDNPTADSFDQQSCGHKFVYVTFDDKTVDVFTDHFSKIPLFFSYSGDKLLFATSVELLSVLKRSQQFDIDHDGLLFYYNYGFSNYQNYLIKGIESVPGGKHVSYSLHNGTLKQKSYYDIFEVKRYADTGNSLNENIQLIDQELLKSTEATIANFNHIGIALSGGVDSGYLAQKIHESGRDFNAYTLGFKNDYNEFDRIDYLSDRLNFNTNKIIIDEKEIIDNYLEVSQSSSFPVGFNNSILNIIYKHASADDVDLMFDGDGADRLFLGMNKYLQLQKILQLYDASKSLKINVLMTKVLSVIKHPSAGKLGFYFKKFNENYPFYGERKLSDEAKYISEFEIQLNDLALPAELKKLVNSIDSWLFFSLFSVYYTPAFFFHTPYELQLKHNIVSNPQFWSDDMVNIALSIPVSQKLHKKTTKMVLREAAKLKIDDGYWNLSKIGLQNSYEYIKQSAIGKEFVNAYTEVIRKSDEYLYLQEALPEKTITEERLLPYWIWKENLKSSE